MRVLLDTDDRVTRVVKHFASAPHWEVLHPIDSLNCGEGFDLRWNGMVVRLYDDERFDEVCYRFKGKLNPESYEHIYQEVVREMAGEVCLTFEIDRYDESSSNQQVDCVTSIRTVLKNSGYPEDDISVES